MTDSFSFDLFISSISLDTREWATLLVLVTLLLLAVAFAKNKLDYFISVASSLFDVCKAALSIWIVVPAALIVGWSCLVFWATFESGFWSYSNSTDVIESILFSGMGSMAIAVRAKSGQGLFHELVINEFALSTVTSFYVGLECSMFFHMLLALCRQHDVFTRLVVQIKSFNDFWRQVPYYFHASIIPYLVSIKDFPIIQLSKNSSLLTSLSFALCFLESTLFIANPEEKRCTDSHCDQIDWQSVTIKC